MVIFTYYILDASVSGQIGLNERRLNDREVNQISSGDIYVYDKNNSTIHFWRDEMVWGTNQ